MVLLSDGLEKERKGSKREPGQEGILILSLSHVDSHHFPTFLFFLMLVPLPLVPTHSRPCLASSKNQDHRTFELKGISELNWISLKT